MAATSPYTQNDYQAVSNFRPYELPINDIFKAISAQNAFWDAGAAKVKSVYDNALNLKLSLEPNKEIRKQYMEDAEKQLTKLSSMDLADPSVQRQGFALFKPLYQDEGIVYDDLTTRHYEKVRNDALSYRNRDNGKQYSDINFQYAMQGYNEFINSKDRMAGKQFYQNRKEYTPYHDYTEDFQRALKDCKPSSIETQSPNYGSHNAMTGYMVETYSKGLSAAQARGCLEAGLSPNAARQLQIEGAVGYKNNINVLASDTATYLSGVSGNISNQLQEITAKKAALATKKDISDADKKLINEQLDNEIKGLQQELDKTNNQTKKILAGDHTDILNNFDAYAGSVYSYKKLYKKALASAFEERRHIYKADPVQLNAIRFTQEQYLRRMEFGFDVSLKDMDQHFEREMKLLDLMYGGSGSKGGSTNGADIFRNPLTGEITVNPNLMRETANLSGKPEVNEKIYSELTDAVSSLSAKDAENNLSLYNNLKNRGERDKPFRENLLKSFNYGTSDDEWARFKADHANNNFGGKGIEGTPWFKSYTAEKPNDEAINDWSYKNSLIETGISVLNRKLELGEAEVRNRMGGDFSTVLSDNIKDYKSVNTSLGEVTPLDIQNFLSGKPSRFSMTEDRRLVSTGTSSVESVTPSYFIDGKEVKLGEAMNSGLERLFQKVKRKNEDINNKLNETRVDVYNTLGFNREPWYFTNDDGKSRVSETIKAVLGPDKDLKELPIKIISSDFSGGVKVSIPGVVKGAKKSEVTEDILTKLRNAGVGTSVEATGDGVVTIKGTTHNVIQQAIQNPLLGEAAFHLSTIGETSAFTQTQEGDRVAQGDITIPVMIRGIDEKMTIETYKKDGRPEYRVFIEGATNPAPKYIASNAYELFEWIGRAPMEFKKPIR